MSLVAYSDSEGSDDEKPQSRTDKSQTKPAISLPNSNFAVNKSNPRKIQVKLHDLPDNDGADGEPAPKRPRVGGGTFSGFNAMLPAPKRDSDSKAPAKHAARNVFSLKTGAEPGFSRESDAELRQLFAEQDGGNQRDQEDTIPSVTKNTNLAENVIKEQPKQGNTFMFKPLSVARNNKKPKRKTDTSKPALPNTLDKSRAPSTDTTSSDTAQNPEPAPPPKKVSLFSMNNEPEPVPAPVPVPQNQEDDEIIEILDEPVEGDISARPEFPSTAPENFHSQSLDTIASDLNLSKAARRQLFGRLGHASGTAVNVVNFNTDQEYAANEALRAAGEQVQHNPVRAIAPGKHSLKQLVSAATGQKDALEESFATGRKNKKEAGSKYGW